MNEGFRNVWTISKRELGGYFNSPVAYVFIVIFLLLNGFFTFMLFPLILRFTYLLSALIPMEETSYSPGPGFAAAGVGAADYCFMKRFSVVPNAPMLDCQFFKGPSAFLAVYYPGPGSSLP